MVASKEIKMMLKQLPVICTKECCRPYDITYLKELYKEINSDRYEVFSTRQSKLVQKRFFSKYTVSVVQICSELYICKAMYYIEQNLVFEKCRPYIKILDK